MENIIAGIGIGTILILFFYFGYRDDYNRNPKEFLKILIGVPIGGLAAILGFTGFTKLVQKWIKKDREELE